MLLVLGEIVYQVYVKVESSRGLADGRGSMVGATMSRGDMQTG